MDWKRVLSVVTIVTCLSCVHGQTTPAVPYQYPPNCAAPNQTVALHPGTVLPPFPYIPDTFQVRVEANIIDKGWTTVAEEYYDNLNNRAALRTIQNNTMDYLVFDYKYNQLLYVVNNWCHAEDLQYDDNQLLFGMKGLPNMPHIYSTSQALHFARVNGLTYFGQSTVRGILTDHWQSCMSWPMLGSNFTLDYYFSVFNWTDPDLSHQVPVRAEIHGSQTVFKARNFHHIYEYFDFRNKIWGDDSVFETPQGMTCKNRKQTRPVPVLTNQYSYREEIVSVGDNAVSMADVWYDFPEKLVRFDYRPPYSAYPYYTTNPVTEIHDYQSGIAYSIDRAQGNCSIIPIQNATFDASVNISKTTTGKNQFVIRMKSPSQLFYLDNTSYTYEGKRTVRNQLCDTFISNRTDFSLPNYGPFNSTFEFYFLDQSWNAINNVGKNVKMATDIPVQLVINTPSWVGYHAVYNIYDFDAEDPADNKFDVTKCFPDSAKQNFIIKFPGTFDTSMNMYNSAFLTATTDTIKRFTHVSHVRIQNAKFHIDPTGANFVGTLLDLPPPLSYYRRLPGKYSQNGNDQTVTVTSAADCATACNSPKISACNSFDYCAGQNLCTLSKLHVDDGNLVQSGGLCDHYARTVQMAPLEVNLVKSYNALKNMVLISNFIINVPINGVTQKFTASTIDNNVSLNSKRTLSTQSLIGQFNMQVNKAIPGYDDLILTGIAIDDCAQGCITQESWVCNSFSYSFTTGYCILSRLHPDERPSVVTNTQMTDLYSRKYTSGYQMISGYTILASSDTIYQNIYSADECAKLCTNYNSFNCKSFDYCDGISTCYLGKTHFFDAPQANKQMSTTCNHYSRKYLADFQITRRKKMTNVADRLVSNIPVDQCAKLCVDEESISCASFGYCGNTTECRLSTASMKNIGQVTSEASLWCDIYNRETFPDGTPYINNPQKYYSQPASTGYTGGAMAGLAFGMLVVGLLLAVGIYFGISKFRGQAPDGMQVSFVKSEHDA